MAGNKFYGIDLDECGRCIHYRKKLDILLMQCSSCERFYSCYKCHNRLEDHSFKAVSIKRDQIILCGVCRKMLNFSEYKNGQCCYCENEFNPGCMKHSSIYWRK